jgi:uncharacterized protein (TIGR03067 family)
MKGERTEFEAAYRLDPRHAPKRINLTDVKSSRTVKGIYQLDGDDLEIVYDEGATANQYPTAFVSERGPSPNDRFLTLKRIKGQVIPHTARAADRTEKDRAELQGIWSGMVAEVGGRRASPSENVPLPEAKVYIRGDDLILRGVIYGNVVSYVASTDTTFKLKADASKAPTTIDLTVPPAPDDLGPTTYLGIYRLEGDDLVICLTIPNKKRPTELKTKEGTLQMLLKLKRDKATEWKPLPKRLLSRQPGDEVKSRPGER